VPKISHFWDFLSPDFQECFDSNCHISLLGSQKYRRMLELLGISTNFSFILWWMIDSFYSNLGGLISPLHLDLIQWACSPQYSKGLDTQKKNHTQTLKVQIAFKM
jgi:hypothetical protein